MKEYRYTPRAKNRLAHIISVSLTVFGLLAFIFVGYLPTYVGVLRTVSVCLVVAGIFFATKFIFSVNTYILMTAENGVTYFLVEQTQGKRSSLLCQFPLSRITDLRTLRAGIDKTPGGRYFAYVATFGLREYQLVSAIADDGGKIQVKLEADEAFLAEFRARLAAPKPIETED